MRVTSNKMEDSKFIKELLNPHQHKMWCVVLILEAQKISMDSHSSQQETNLYAANICQEKCGKSISLQRIKWISLSRKQSFLVARTQIPVLVFMRDVINLTKHLRISLIQLFWIITVTRRPTCILLKIQKWNWMHQTSLQKRLRWLSVPESELVEILKDIH